MSRTLALALLLSLSCSQGAGSEGEPMRGMGGVPGSAGESSTGGAAGAGAQGGSSAGGELGEPAGAAGGSSPGADTGGGGTETAEVTQGGSPETGGAGEAAPTVQRCDFIVSCQSVPEACAAGIGTTCGACKLGTYACGDVSGFYADDGADFPCARSGAGLDCSDAAAAASAHCAACQN